MVINAEFDVEFNGHSPMNRNDPQQDDIFGSAGLEKNVNKGIAEFSSIFAQSVLECHLTIAAELIFSNSVESSASYGCSNLSKMTRPDNMPEKARQS